MAKSQMQGPVGTLGIGFIYAICQLRFSNLLSQQHTPYSHQSWPSERSK